MASHISYHKADSCGEDDLLGFIKEIQDGIDNNKDAFDIEQDVLSRLIRCINDRFEFQDKKSKTTLKLNKQKKKTSKIIQDHINIIKVYYDFFVKLQRYFPILILLLSDKLVSIVQYDYYDKSINSYNHTLWLLFNKENEIIPFTQISVDPSYLLDLNFSEDFDSKHNESILNKYIPDWTQYKPWINNPDVKLFEKYKLEEQDILLRFRKSKRKISKRKISKRKISKRKISKRKISKRKISKRKISKRKSK